MGRKALDITLVKELACLDEVGIPFLQLALLDFLVVIDLLIVLVHLSVAGVYEAMRIP